MKNLTNSGVLVSLWASVVLGLMGCSKNDTNALPPPAIEVSYVDSDSFPAIAVVVTRPQPLIGVELVAPDGRFVAASQIEQGVPRGSAALPPTVGVGVFGGSGGGFGTGIGLGFPLGGSGSPPPSTGTRARARVVIPDIEAYRRDWQRYVVRLKFAGEPVTVAEIPAPQPRR